MPLEPHAAYLVLKARDARFDGRLFVGVTSTGIYCRPICRVRLPKAENCRFFSHAAGAERDGFRPCLRCRPELAPGLSLMDSSQSLAHHAARMLEHAARTGGEIALPQVAQRLGVTDRHLRRIFLECHGVAPIDYLTTQRLLLAKQLLTDTQLPVTQVALASGFGSVRRFNAAFAERYRMNPSALRREQRGAMDAGPVVLRLSYRPPYDVAGMLRSFHYAPYAVLLNPAALEADAPARDWDVPALEPWVRLWHRSVSAEFVRGYLAAAGPAPFLPQAPGGPVPGSYLLALLDTYLLDKAVYELAYELNNRPTWVGIPIEGILQLLG